MTKEDYLKEIFKDIIGQDLPVELLVSSLKKKHIAPAYLFSGPEGVGKKLTATKFIEALLTTNSQGTFIKKRIENRNHPDLLWIEPTYIHQGNLITTSEAIKDKHNFRTLPQIRLEQIKNIKQFLGRKPIESKVGIVMIENVDNINESASNALLKILEEPRHGIFILTTERAENLLSTINSRCQSINFRRLKNSYLSEILTKNCIAGKEYLDCGLKQKELLALSNGSPGAILKNIDIWHEIPKNIWDKVKRIPNNSPIDALSSAKDITETLDTQQQIWLISWLQQYMWIKDKNLKALKILEKLKVHIKSFVNPRLAWEVALIQINDTN